MDNEFLKGCEIIDEITELLQKKKCKNKQATDILLSILMTIKHCEALGMKDIFVKEKEDEQN